MWFWASLILLLGVLKGMFKIYGKRNKILDTVGSSYRISCIRASLSKIEPLTIEPTFPPLEGSILSKNNVLPLLHLLKSLCKKINKIFSRSGSNTEFSLYQISKNFYFVITNFTCSVLCTKNFFWVQKFVFILNEFSYNQLCYNQI